MKTNLFKVKEINDDEIIIEEERTKNPIILFFLRYGRLIYLILMVLSISTFLIGFGMTLSNLGKSSFPEEGQTGVTISIDGSSDINMNGVPITDEYAKKLFDKLLDDTISTKGVILITSKTIFSDGTITFYSDKTALIKYNDGTYERVFPVLGNYGVDTSGNINSKAITKKLTGEIRQVGDATILYLSDGSAEITKNGVTIFVRNSEDIDLNSNNFIETMTSGVSTIKNTENKNNTKITYYTNDVVKIEKDGNTYIVRNNEDYIVDENGTITFLNNNAAVELEKKELKDGTIIIFYDDGSAEIISDNTSIMVRKSGDIVYNNSGVIEIVETQKDYIVTTKTLADGTIVEIFDDGSAVITRENTNSYVEDCSDIKYDDNGSIKDITSNKAQVIDEKTLPDGTKITNFDNGKTLVEPKDGKKYIVDTSNLSYDDNGNIDEDKDNLINTKTISITNTTGDTISYRLVIEETDDYEQYNVKRLIPDYVRFVVNINDETSSIDKLSSNMWNIGSTLEGGLSIENNTYILDEGTLEDGKTINALLGLWISYEDITNEYQNSAFIGTVKLYIE